MTDLSAAIARLEKGNGPRPGSNWMMAEVDDLRTVIAVAKNAESDAKELRWMWEQASDAAIALEKERDALVAVIEEARALLRAPFPGQRIPKGSRIGPHDWVQAGAEARNILSRAPENVLAERDARVRAEALREAVRVAQTAYVEQMAGLGYVRVKAAWLLDRADAIEREAGLR